ncbi:MAG: GGDEF domain-containing protein [Gammaproteobacteria bacterium]
MPFTEKKPERASRKKFSITPSSISHILDETQGHLILRWDAWRSTHHRNEIGLSALYCLVALFFLVFFATEAFLRFQTLHAQVLLGFAILTVCCFAYLRTTGNKRSTNTFVVILFGALCLFLFYTSGINGTGPLWYFVFPLVALYIQRLWAGILSVLILFILTILLLTLQPAGFDPSLYSQDFIERLFAVYLAISIMAFLYAFIRTSAELNMDNINRNYRNLANTDELTKLPNRRRMTEVLYQEVARNQRNQTTFSIIIFDIDYFKKLNDLHGHDAGDAVLKAVPEIIHKILRSQDICARWGGEEFLVLLPETGLAGARHVAERLRTAFEEYITSHMDIDLSVTISLGVFEFKDAFDLDDCIKQADKNLYQAKHDGRNRVVAGPMGSD